MKPYTTNKTIYETNECGAYKTPEFNFPIADDFAFKQIYSINDNYILFEASYDVTHDVCPKCEYRSHSVKEYKYIYPVIGELNGKIIIAKIRKRSFRCINDNCEQRTFVQTIKYITKRRRFSKLVNSAILDSLSSSVSYKTIATRFSTSIITIQRAIDRIAIARESKSTVKNIMVDETRLLNKFSKKHGIYQFFIYDADTKVLLDILEDRSYNKVLEYLNCYFYKGSLSTITMDMWVPYKNAMNSIDPNTNVIIDKFHFVRYIMNSFDNIRLQIMNEAKYKTGVNSSEYKLLKSKLNVRNLRKNPNKLKEGVYEEICSFLEEYPTLYLAYKYKNDFLEAIKTINSSSSFRLFIQMYMREIKKLNTKCFDDTLTVFSNWEKEIANSFDFKYTNAYVEGTNQKVKLMKRISYGYSNLERTKKRLMLLLGKRAILKSSIQEAI